MFEKRSIVRSVALALACSPAFFQPAYAVTDDEMRELREQVRQLKQSYESRIEALEKRLQQAEQSAGKAEAAAGKAETAAAKAESFSAKAEGLSTKAESVVQSAVAQAGSRPAGEGAMNPGVSLIMNGTYGNLTRPASTYRINGFAPTGGEVAPIGRGLSLGESELVFSANIDPRFRGTVIAALGADDRIGVEEAFIQTLDLDGGLTAKAGRFLAGVGYLNEIHPHAWDFADAPLASKVFLGNQLGEDGVQVKWVAPSNIYFDLGAEFGRGRKFPAGPDNGRDKNGFGSGNFFTHLGGDIGASTAWQVGASYLMTQPQGRTWQDTDAAGTNVTDSFSGKSRLLALSGVLKWAPNGNSTVNNFKLQGEYFRRRENGALTYDTAAASLGTQTGDYRSAQSGWYTQGVYQFARQWRAGYRYDRLSPGTTSIGLVNSGALTAANFPILASYKPTRDTVMLDWSGSEFSRVRVQLARDRSRAGLPADNQMVLQYIMSLGAHGAHKF